MIKAEREGELAVVPEARVLAALEGRPGVWLEVPGLAQPVVVLRVEGQWRALHARCPHQECPVRPTKRFLACTCHSSRFAFDGRVLGGPAPGPLPVFPVETQGADLQIRLRG